METNRIETLTDGVFAIVMTLLILSLDVPKSTSDPASLANDLKNLLPAFLEYLVAFILLGSFWVTNHKQYQYILSADNLFLWINLIGLVFIAIIPFSISLFGESRNNQLAAVFFEINILIIGLIKYWQWIYATNNRRLVDHGLDSQTVERGKRMNLVVPLFSVIALIGSFISPEYSLMAFMGVPIVMAKLKA